MSPQFIAERERKRIECNASLVAGLRAMADFWEANPDIDLAVWPELYAHAYKREDFLKGAAQLARGGKLTKKAPEEEYGDGDFKVTREFAGLRVSLSIAREKLCRLVTAAVYDCPPLLEGIGELEDESNG